MKLFGVVVAFVFFSVCAVADNKIYVFPWNNYTLRSLGLPAVVGVGGDVSGVQVVVAGDSLPADSVFSIKVQYKVGDDLRTAEGFGKLVGGAAACFFTLGRHDEDYKVTRVTATPYVKSSPDIELDMSK